MFTLMPEAVSFATTPERHCLEPTAPQADLSGSVAVRLEEAVRLAAIDVEAGTCNEVGLH